MKYVERKFFNCHLVAKCKIYIKKQKYDSCKVSKKHSESITCSKNRKCNVYTLCENPSQYMIEKYYINCTGKKEKCVGCENLLPKYISDSKYSNFINEYFTDCCFKMLYQMFNFGLA